MEHRDCSSQQGETRTVYGAVCWIPRQDNTAFYALVLGFDRDDLEDDCGDKLRPGSTQVYDGPVAVVTRFMEPWTDGRRIEYIVLPDGQVVSWHDPTTKTERLLRRLFWDDNPERGV